MTDFVEESDPLKDFKDLLDIYWVSYQSIPRPEILVANDPEEPISRIDLNFGDYIVITSDRKSVV